MKKPTTQEKIAINRRNGPISEGGHKAGCQCGFCKNKGSFGKKKDDDGEKPEVTAESIVTTMLDEG